MEVPTDDGDVEALALFDASKPELSVAMPRRKAYIVLDQETLDGLARALEAKIGDALEGVPEEQRAEVEAELREQIARTTGTVSQDRQSEYEYRASGDRRAINGYPAERYEVYDGDRKLREVWISDWKQVDGSPGVLAGLEALARFAERIQETMGQQGDFPISSILRFDQLAGFPVMTLVFLGDGEVASVTRLVRSERLELGPSTFEVPAGYERQELQLPDG